MRALLSGIANIVMRPFVTNRVTVQEFIAGITPKDASLEVTDNFLKLFFYGNNLKTKAKHLVMAIKDIKAEGSMLDIFLFDAEIDNKEILGVKIEAFSRENILALSSFLGIHDSARDKPIIFKEAFHMRYEDRELFLSWQKETKESLLKKYREIIGGCHTKVADFIDLAIKSQPEELSPTIKHDESFFEASEINCLLNKKEFLAVKNLLRREEIFNDLLVEYQEGKMTIKIPIKLETVINLDRHLKNISSIIFRPPVTIKDVVEDRPAIAGAGQEASLPTTSLTPEEELERLINDNVAILDNLGAKSFAINHRREDEIFEIQFFDLEPKIILPETIGSIKISTTKDDADKLHMSVKIKNIDSFQYLKTFLRLDIARKPKISARKKINMPTVAPFDKATKDAEVEVVATDIDIVLDEPSITKASVFNLEIFNAQIDNCLKAKRDLAKKANHSMQLGNTSELIDFLSLIHKFPNELQSLMQKLSDKREVAQIGIYGGFVYGKDPQDIDFQVVMSDGFFSTKNALEIANYFGDLAEFIPGIKCEEHKIAKGSVWKLSIGERVELTFIEKTLHDKNHNWSSSFDVKFFDLRENEFLFQPNFLQHHQIKDRAPEEYPFIINYQAKNWPLRLIYQAFPQELYAEHLELAAQYFSEKLLKPILTGSLYEFNRDGSPKDFKQKLHEEAIKFMKAHGFEDREEKREHFLENINNILTIIEKNLPHQSISAQSFIAMDSKFSHAHQRK